MDDTSAHITTPALFLDRDGTLTYPYHDPSRPEHLRLYPGIGEPLRALQQEGFRVIVVTNQSGIARGYFSEDELERMHIHLRAMLEEQGVRIDAIYHCPHHPDGVINGLNIRCACRKPQPGMILRAADDLNLDLRRSWFVGDILDDIEAGARAGCRTVLVDVGTESLPQSALRQPTFVAPDTRHALEIIGGMEGLRPLPDITYRPASWRCDTSALAAAPGDAVNREWRSAWRTR